MVEIDGKKIREARLQLALSPAEFADLLGVTDRTIRNWEAGHTGIRRAEARTGCCLAVRVLLARHGRVHALLEVCLGAAAGAA
jgi:transcriptional regulator with XRE-family HTH domain